MSTPDNEQKKTPGERELRIQRQIGFASGLFQEEVTIRTILESIAEGIVVVDEHGTILLVNSSAERMFGYSRQDLIGRPHSLLIPERFRTGHETHEAGYFREPKIRPMGLLLDLAGRRRDGSEFPVEISLGFIETSAGILVLAFVSDITLRKEYESQLKESDMLFRTQVECIKDYAIFMLDARGNVLNWNAGAERLEGYRSEEIIGRHFSCFYSEEDRKGGKPEELLAKAQEEGRVEAEGWRVRKDGSRFWADVIITAIRDEDCKLRGFSKVTRDSTERMQAEAALRKSEQKFAKIFHSVPALIGISTLEEGRYIDINETALRLLGYRRDEVIGRTAQEVKLWEDPSVQARVLQTLKEQGAIKDLEVRFRGKSGQIFTGLFSAEIVAFNGDRYRLGLVKDITDRKQVEEALRQREEMLRLFVEHSPAAIAMLDNDMKYLIASHHWFEIYHLEAGDILGRSHYEVFPDIPEKWKEVHRRCLAGATERNEADLWNRADGTSVWIHWETRPWYKRENEIGGLVIFTEDISERKQAEEEIERLNTQLAAWAAELEAANRELEAFNYTVAHDLRKPLTIVNGYCHVIQELCGDKLDEECRAYLREAYDGTWRMNRLIDTLLDFSRASRAEPSWERVDLSDLAQAVAKELKLSDPSRRATFRIAEGIPVIGDAGLLRVVLENLLGNAWKYTAIREEAIIEFGMAEVEGQRAFFVRDNGPGFAKEDADRLFLPFQRLPGAEKEAGFGIGLATVERIIRRHGGRVWAEGKPGKGATFYFTLGSQENQAGEADVAEGSRRS